MDILAVRLEKVVKECEDIIKSVLHTETIQEKQWNKRRTNFVMVSIYTGDKSLQERLEVAVDAMLREVGGNNFSWDKYYRPEDWEKDFPSDFREYISLKN